MFFLSQLQTTAATPPLCAAIRSLASLVATEGEVFPLLPPLPPKKLLLLIFPPLLAPPTLLATAESTPPNPTAEVETCAPRRMGGCW